MHASGNNTSNIAADHHNQTSSTTLLHRPSGTTATPSSITSTGGIVTLGLGAVPSPVSPTAAVLPQDLGVAPSTPSSSVSITASSSVPLVVMAGAGSPPPAAAAVAPVSQSTFLVALAQFAVSSVAMMLGNKAAVGALPLPCTLVIIQAFGTLGLLALFRNSIATMKVETARVWLPIAVLFCVMLFTSLKSFVYAGVSTVIVFRNVGAIITTIAEYFVRGTVVNTKIVASELLIVVGAVLYAGGTVDFSWNGLFWIMFNVTAQVAYGVYLKKAMDSEPALRDMSKYTMSLYNNSLALPMIFVVLFLQGEHTVLAAKLTDVTVWGWFIIAVTCVFGFMISTSGFGLQKLVSATTFLVINNMTKFLNILLGMLLMNDRLVGFADAGGCLLAILAGCWYSYEQMQLNDKAKVAKSSH